MVILYSVSSQIGLPARVNIRKLDNWRRRMTCSKESILLFPKDKHWSDEHCSRPSMIEILLLYNDKSSKCFRLRRPCIFWILLNDKSSHLKLTKWSRPTISFIWLLSKQSLVRLSRPTKFSILPMLWKERTRDAAMGHISTRLNSSRRSPDSLFFTVIPSIKSLSSITCTSGFFPDLLMVVAKYKIGNVMISGRERRNQWWWKTAAKDWSASRGRRLVS